MRSFALGSRLKDRALVSGVCIYRQPGGTLSVSECWVLSLLSGGAGGVPGLGGAGRGGGAPGPLCLQRVCGFFAMALWQGSQPSDCFSRIIAVCLSIAAFTLLCPGKPTPRIFSSRNSAWGFLTSYHVCSIVACENPSFAILAIFRARRMSDCSSCTWPPGLAIVAEMLKT